MIKNIMQRSIYVILFSIMCVSSANAQDYSHSDRLPMTRADPKEPILRSAIIEAVKAKFPGTILSITAHKKGGEDCRRVNTMSKENIFRIVMVACN